MNIIPYREGKSWFDPLNGLDSLQSEIGNFLRPMSKLIGEDGGIFEREWRPAIDVYDSDNALLVKADIPGLKKDEIDVSIHDGTLTIKGEKKMENEVNEENYFRSERFYGSFTRSIQLPTEVERDKVTATYKDGVLELKLPKREEAKTKRISVEVG